MEAAKKDTPPKSDGNPKEAETTPESMGGSAHAILHEQKLRAEKDGDKIKQAAIQARINSQLVRGVERYFGLGGGGA